MTIPAAHRRTQRRKEDQPMGNEEIWRTLGELEANARERTEQVKRIFEVLGEVKDAMGALHAALKEHIASEEARTGKIEEAAGKIEKLEGWKDRGLVVLGAVAASAGGIGAAIHTALGKLGGGH